MIMECKNSLGLITAQRVILDPQSPKKCGLQQHLALRTVEPQYFHNCYLKSVALSSSFC